MNDAAQMPIMILVILTATGATLLQCIALQGVFPTRN
jgi:hypothetical protein